MQNSTQPVAKERLYLHAPAACILMQVTFAAPVAAQALAAAIDRAAARQAVLCSRVKQLPDGAAVFEPCAPVSARVQLALPGESLCTAMHEEMRTPFDVEHGAWMRHRLWQQQTGSVWLLAAHHMAGDGLSMLYFIRDVQCALDDPSLQWQQEPFCLCTPAAMRGRLPLPLRTGVRVLNRAWARGKKVFTPIDRARVTQAYWGDRVLAMECETVEPAALVRMLAACRQHNVTLTAAFLAAAVRTIGGTVDAGLAVNIRPDGLEGLANWATGISVQYAAQGKDFWQAAQEIFALMQQKLQNENKRNFLLQFLQALSPTLIDAAYYSAFDGLPDKTARTMSSMFGYSGNPKGCSVTNLMRAPFAGKGIRALAFYPPMVPNAKLLFGLVTLDGSLAVTLESFAEPAQARRLLKGILAQLDAAGKA